MTRIFKNIHVLSLIILSMVFSIIRIIWYFFQVYSVETGKKLNLLYNISSYSDKEYNRKLLHLQHMISISISDLFFLIISILAILLICYFGEYFYKIINFIKYQTYEYIPKNIFEGFINHNVTDIKLNSNLSVSNEIYFYNGKLLLIYTKRKYDNQYILTRTIVMKSNQAIIYYANKYGNLFKKYVQSQHYSLSRLNNALYAIKEYRKLTAFLKKDQKQLDMIKMKEQEILYEVNGIINGFHYKMAGLKNNDTLNIKDLDYKINIMLN